MYKLLSTFFVLGLSFGWGPCLASCGPVLITYSAGTKKGAGPSLKAYLLFCAGRIIVYIGLGLAAFSAGHFLSEKLNSPPFIYLKYVLAGAVILSGAFVLINSGFGLGKSTHPVARHCCRLAYSGINKDQKSLFVLGVIIGLMPCAPLLGIFSYLAGRAINFYQSIACAFVFGVGTVFSPLLLYTITAGFVSAKLLHASPLISRLFSLVCGIILVAQGVRILTGG